MVTPLSGPALVTAALAATGLGPVALAQVLGVHYQAVWYWQAGRRPCEGPARVLLGLLARRPELAVDLERQSTREP